MMEIISFFDGIVDAQWVKPNLITLAGFCNCFTSVKNVKGKVKTTIKSTSFVLQS